MDCFDRNRNGIAERRDVKGAQGAGEALALDGAAGGGIISGRSKQSRRAYAAGGSLP
jgi:hypothetical protein